MRIERLFVYVCVMRSARHPSPTDLMVILVSLCDTDLTLKRPTHLALPAWPTGRERESGEREGERDGIELIIYRV